MPKSKLLPPKLVLPTIFPISTNRQPTKARNSSHPGLFFSSPIALFEFSKILCDSPAKMCILLLGGQRSLCFCFVVFVFFPMIYLKLSKCFLKKINKISTKRLCHCCFFLNLAIVNNHPTTF